MTTADKSAAAPEAAGETPRKAPARGPAPAAGPARMMGGQPTEKSMDFKGSGTRLLAQMRPERGIMSVALALGVLSVALTVVGPKVLGHATDLIVSGIIGRQLPAGLTRAQAAAQLRAHGEGGLADMIATMPVTPAGASTSAPSARSCSGSP